MPLASQVADNKDSTGWGISIQANDLLECFVSGLDDVILKIAIANASERRSKSGHVRVEAADVQAAAEHVLSQILNESSLPESLKEEIRQTEECLKEKCRKIAQ